MTFKPEYYPGCVVHHKDENKGHNYAENLEVESRNDHSRHHANPDAMLEWQKKNGGPVNKGQKMSAEFCEKCRQSALNRWGSFKVTNIQIRMVLRRNKYFHVAKR